MAANVLGAILLVGLTVALFAGLAVWTFELIPDTHDMTYDYKCYANTTVGNTTVHFVNHTSNATC